ncbi:MAG TPA: hypothetical protein PLU14_03605 [Caldisericia bacterium]|nr:hypothetical protein [Caldisericia bacterium]
MKFTINNYYFKSTYIAKVNGKDNIYKLAREFLKPSHIVSTATYDLENGIYEIKDREGTKLIAIKGDKVKEISRNDIEKLFADRPSTSKK